MATAASKPSKPVFITPTAHGWNLLQPRDSNGAWNVRLLRSLDEVVPLLSAEDDIVLSLPVAAVLVAGAFVPLNFIAVRLAQQYVHPRVLTLGGGNLPGSMRLTFTIALIGIALLYVTLWKYEMAAKNARMQIRALRRALIGDDAVRPLRRSAAPS